MYELHHFIFLVQIIWSIEDGQICHANEISCESTTAAKWILLSYIRKHFTLVIYVVLSKRAGSENSEFSI